MTTLALKMKLFRGGRKGGREEDIFVDLKWNIFLWIKVNLISAYSSFGKRKERIQVYSVKFASIGKYKLEEGSEFDLSPGSKNRML